MDRLSFYKIVAVDGINELDYASSTLSNFRPKYELTTYRVTEEDLLSPDNISYKVYGTEQYWWLILYFNKIVDPFVDMKVGDLLYIPSLLDVYEFYKSNSLR